MSLDLINHKLTTSTTDENGIITWSNPAVLVKINSKGEVYDNAGNKLKPHNGIRKRYYIDMSNNGVCFKHPVTYKSLFSRIVLGVKLGGANTFILKDTTKGFVKDNVEIVSTGTLRCKGVMRNNLSKYNKAVSLHKDGLTTKEMSNVVGVTTHTVRKWIEDSKEQSKQEKQPMQLVLDDIKHTNVTDDIKEACTYSSDKQFYTVYEAKNEHTTEDGAVFPTKELAQWHQEKVSKGKGNAQVVLDYNGGFVLAEQIYFQEVIYNKEKPYTNFVDVLNNNQGVVSNVQEEHCKFDKIDGEGFEMLTDFKMGGVYNLTTSRFKAVKIQEALELYAKTYKEFNDSASHLGKLIKESV